LAGPASHEQFVGRDSQAIENRRPGAPHRRPRHPQRARHLADRQPGAAHRQVRDNRSGHLQRHQSLSTAHSYAKIATTNLTSLFAWHAQKITDKLTADRRYKYKINFSVALSNMKDVVVHLLRGGYDTLDYVAALLTVMSVTSEAVRPGRRYPRRTGPRLDGYHAPTSQRVKETALTSPCHVQSQGMWEMIGFPKAGPCGRVFSLWCGQMWVMISIMGE
jgi:hypothetical protein